MNTSISEHPSKAFTVFKVNLKGESVNKEHLNSVDELNTWMDKHKYATVKIIHDASGRFAIFTDSGEDYEIIETGILQ
jgi:hypothetical protein